MIEKKRQIVIFGNFNSITFDSLTSFSEIKNEYKFQINAMPDIPNEVRTPVGQPVVINPNGLNIRPVFQSEDKKTSVFFGLSRIHIEQLDQDVDSYDEYYNMAIKVIQVIVENSSVTINRIAINGQILDFDKEAMESRYTKIFKKSKLYGENSDEWQIRINTKEKINTLSCEINKIISYARGFVFETLTGEPKESLITTYDFNTKQGLNREFSLEEIKDFYSLGYEYRKNLLN